MRVFFIVILSISLHATIHSLPALAQEQDHGHDHGHGHDAPTVEPNAIEEALQKKSAKKIFRGYAKYRDDIKLICEELYGDGRIRTFLNITKTLSERDPACVACRPYMTSFATICSNTLLKKEKLAAKAIKKQVENIAESPEASPDSTPIPTPTPLPFKQRDPSTELLHSLSSLGNKIIEDADITEESIKAVQKLVFALRTKTFLSSESEIKYMDTLAEYIYAPFLEVANQQNEKLSTEESATEEAPQAAVDDLFSNE